MKPLVQLVFRGEVLEGFRGDAVKRSLADLLKLDDAKQARLFSGSRTVIKRALEPAEAQRYVAQFAKLGARLHVEPVDAPKGPGSAAPLPPIVPGLLAAPAAKPAAPRPAPPAPAAPLSLLPAAPPAEEQIVCPHCGETQSKRILCRSCATDMPMGIAAKIEAEQEARAARLDSWRAKRGLGPAGERSAADDDAPGLWGLGFTGRMARLPYATSGALTLAALYLATVFVLKQPTLPRLALFGLALLAILFVSVRAASLRLQDCNLKAWWVVLFMVPYLDILFGLALMLMPGTSGDNDHGGTPRAGRWVFLLLSIGALGAAIGLSWTTMKTLYDNDAGWQSMDFLSTPRADGGVPALPSEAATAAFRNDYLAAPAHKAFAVAPDGSWGWMGAAPSLRAAVRGAVANCEANHRPGTCEPINVNGHEVSAEAQAE